MSKKVLVPFAYGFEELEFVSIVDVLRRAGIEVVTASITDDLNITGANNIIIKADELLSNIDYKSFDAISLPGGDDCANALKGNMLVLDIIKKMHGDKKLVSAVCASPTVLAAAEVLNCNYTCYPSYESTISIGNYIKDELVVTDKNIITSQGPATSTLFALEIVKYLESESKANEIKDGILLSKVMNK
jgi:4-methyl-5(b-hydroxyethyl)-thiazole monophosphate biosynthesis